MMVLVGVVKSQRSARERHVARGGDGLQEVPAEQMLNLERGREDRVSTCVEGEPWQKVWRLRLKKRGLERGEDCDK